MGKRLFLIHGWGGSPSKDWIPWAINEFRKMGFGVVAPLMPDTDTPKISAWVDKLQESIGQPNPEDVLVGHSIGCQTILRYLAGLSKGQRVGKVILIAPWIKLTNLENDEAWKIANPWLMTPIDFSVLNNKAESYTTVFSDNDSWVPLKDNENFFKDKLNPTVIVIHNKGHFTEDEGVKEIKEILDLV